MTNVRDMTPEHVAFDGRFGPPFGGWDNLVPNSVIEAFIDARADRMIRHLAVEIDATNEQQDKIKAILHATVKDVLPVRDKMLAARATARELLSQPTVDRAALEKLRAEQIATHEAVSKQIVQAVADAADALTPEQRRKIVDMLPPGGPGFDRGPPRWGWGGLLAPLIARPSPSSRGGPCFSERAACGISQPRCRPYIAWSRRHVHRHRTACGSGGNESHAETPREPAYPAHRGRPASRRDGRDLSRRVSDSR